MQRAASAWQALPQTVPGLALWRGAAHAERMNYEDIAASADDGPTRPPRGALLLKSKEVGLSHRSERKDWEEIILPQARLLVLLFITDLHSRLLTTSVVARGEQDAHIRRLHSSQCAQSR